MAIEEKLFGEGSEGWAMANDESIAAVNQQPVAEEVVGSILGGFQQVEFAHLEFKVQNVIDFYQVAVPTELVDDLNA